jgi:hypothetical protein
MRAWLERLLFDAVWSWVLLAVLLLIICGLMEWRIP